MPEQHPPRIFISYARSDGKAFALDLRRVLTEEHDFTLWQDLHDMEPSSGWWSQIVEAIRQVEYLVLVATPKAMESQIVRDEWRLARREGVCVLPVIASPKLDFSSMPQWMRAEHFVNREQPEQWQRFIRTLEGPCRVARVPFMVVDLPADFVERPNELGTLIAELVDEKRANPIAITTALQGAGGFGKTTLATALCHDERIQDVFYDGILWVTLGEHPGDLTSKVNDLIRMLSADAPGFADVEAASARLTELLESRRAMLLVIDDVWNAAHLKPFLRGGKQSCARLITTRNSATLPPSVHHLLVDAMNTREAMRLLSFGLPDEEWSVLKALTIRFGEWPLLLKLVNGVLRRRVCQLGQPLAAALDYVNRLLDKRGLTAFDAANPESRDQAVRATLSISLGQLEENQRTRFVELAIFPEDVDVPLATVKRLWGATAGLDDLDTEVLCDQLYSVSLLLRLDLNKRCICLHDVIRAYLRHEQSQQLAGLNAQFLDVYGPENWFGLPEEEPYHWYHLAYHLSEAGQRDELRALLFDFAWLRTKLAATNVNALIADYEYFSHEEAARGVQGALRLSAHILAGDPAQLAGQLTGRLLSFAFPDIKGLLATIVKHQSASWLRPLHPTLITPGDPLLRTFTGHVNNINALAVLPDGRRVVSASSDGTVRVWDLDTGAELSTLTWGVKWVTALAMLPDGECVVSGDSDGVLKVWNLDRSEELLSIGGHKHMITALAVLPDGKRIVSGDSRGELKVWDLKRGEMLVTSKGHKWDISTVAVLPDKHLIVSGSQDGTPKLWNWKRGEVLATLTGHENWVTSVAVLPDGQRAVSGSRDCTLKVWDLKSGAELATLREHKYAINTVAVLPDGQRVESGSEDCTVKVWDWRRGEVLATFTLHRNGLNGVSAVAVLPDGRRAIAGFWDGALKLWNLECKKVSSIFPRHESGVIALAMLPNGRQVVSGSWDGTLKVWDLAREEVLSTLTGHEGEIKAVAVLPDGRRAISGDSDGVLKVWDLGSGKTLALPEGHGSRKLFGVCALAALPDGRRAVSGALDGTLKVWDLTHGEALSTLTRHGGGILAIAALPDRQRIVLGCEDGAVEVWDLERGDVVHVLTGHKGLVHLVAILPDGRRAVSGSSDGTMKIWDMECGTALATLIGHMNVVSLAALPDGRRMVSGSKGGTVKVWELESENMIATFTTDSAVFCCDVSPEGSIIVAGDALGRVHFLKLEEL